MPKAVIQDLKDFGFTAEQFGTPADFDAYLQAVIDTAAAHAKDRVGATVYDAATSGDVTFGRLRAAETYYAAAELWRRRKQFFDAAAQAVNAESSERLIARYERNAGEAEGVADRAIALIGGETVTGALAVGRVETGLYSEVG